MFFPDYYGIEIKCTTKFSRYPISLFSKGFDGPTFFEMNRIVEQYGCFNYKYKDRKILMANLRVNELVSVNNNFYFELKVSDTKEKLYVNIYDKNKILVENLPYINVFYFKKTFRIKIN